MMMKRLGRARLPIENQKSEIADAVRRKFL